VLSELPQLLLQQATAPARQPRVVLGCTAAAGAGASVAEEVRQAAAAHDAAASLGKRMVTLLAVAPEGPAGADGEGEELAEQRRRLLAAGAGYGTCDERCRVGGGPAWGRVMASPR
jgi:hypothetical protein